MAISADEIREGLKAVRRLIDNLEKKLDRTGAAEVDPYLRRRRILQQIYWAQNSMTREELMPILESHGTNYAWIGQQVKKGYLSLSPVPGGGTRYSVTPKAVREQRLDNEDEREETFAWSRASEPSFAEDWDSKEDSIYDAL